MSKDFMFVESHEWIKELEEGVVLIGLSQHAVDELGDLVFIDLKPEVGDTFEEGDTLADVESVKAISEVYCPVNGSILEVNEALADAPEELNNAPYDTWIVKMAVDSLPEGLMTEAEYLDFVKDL